MDLAKLGKICLLIWTILCIVMIVLVDRYII